MSYKLISLNIEGNRHLDLVKPFLHQERPDVVCLQEVFEGSVQELAETLHATPFYTAMSNVTTASIHADPFGKWGLLQLVQPGIQIIEQKAEYYVGSAEDIPVFFYDDNPNSINRAVLHTTFEKEGQRFTVATTHFTWSPQGKTTEEQLRDFAALEAVLDRLPPHVLCGDFNAPRGREIFGKLSERYTDNIPATVTTTIDGNLHKAGHIEFVVDGMFSSPGVQVETVQVVDGVSDHCALITTLS